MKKVEISVYEYAELSASAKEVALNHFRNDYDHYEFEAECLKDDAKQIGIRIDSISERFCSGDILIDAEYTAKAIIKGYGESSKAYHLAKMFTEGDLSEERFIRGLLNYYRQMYNEQLEYIDSDEFILETIDSNDCYFFADGSLSPY